MQTEATAGLVDVVQMDKRSIKLQLQIMKSDRGLQTNLRELNVFHIAVLEAQHLALRKVGEAQSCRQ